MYFFTSRFLFLLALSLAIFSWTDNSSAFFEGVEVLLTIGFGSLVPFNWGREGLVGLAVNRNRGCSVLGSNIGIARRGSISIVGSSSVRTSVWGSISTMTHLRFGLLEWISV